jgi:hypothetical protein
MKPFPGSILRSGELMEDRSNYTHGLRLCSGGSVGSGRAFPSNESRPEAQSIRRLHRLQRRGTLHKAHLEWSASSKRSNSHYAIDHAYGNETNGQW